MGRARAAGAGQLGAGDGGGVSEAREGGIGGDEQGGEGEDPDVPRFADDWGGERGGLLLSGVCLLVMRL